MKKTDDMPERIKTLLDNVPGIQCAFIYDSFAKDSKNHEREVDIIVLGGPDLVEMDEVILAAEQELGRPFLITSFTVREFQERIKAKDDTVSGALLGPKMMLLGSEQKMRRTLRAEA